MASQNVFKGGACPVTNVVTPNTTMRFDNFHLSYNASSADYGSDTTAIVVLDRVFFVLNGDHRKELSQASSENGIQGCVDYMIKNIDKTNFRSELQMVIGLQKDHFNLIQTAVEAMGQENVDRLKAAYKKFAG